MNAAVGRRGEAPLVKGDTPGGEEHGVRDRHPVAGADVVRSGLPRDVKNAARRRIASPAWFHPHRAVGDPAVGLQPGEVTAEVRARGRGGRALGQGARAQHGSPRDRRTRMRHDHLGGRRRDAGPHARGAGTQAYGRRGDGKPQDPEMRYRWGFPSICSLTPTYEARGYARCLMGLRLTALGAPGTGREREGRRAPTTRR